MNKIEILEQFLKNENICPEDKEIIQSSLFSLKNGIIPSLPLHIYLSVILRSSQLIDISDIDLNKLEKDLQAGRIQDQKDNLSIMIYQNYPLVKQNSDLSDKLYYENLLKTNGFENLEKTIVEKVIQFFNGETIPNLLKDISDEDKEGIEQLLKVAIRVTWVQKCKKTLKEYLEDNVLENDTVIKYPSFPTI